MSKLAALLSEAKNADPRAGKTGQYFPADFRGLLKVVSCTHKSSQKKKNKEYLVAEFEVLESNLAEVSVGSARSWVLDLTNPDFGIPNAKAFVGACSGFDVDSDECAGLDGDDLLATMEESLIDGRHVRLQTFYKKTAVGGDFTVHTFTPA